MKTKQTEEQTGTLDVFDGWVSPEDANFLEETFSSPEEEIEETNEIIEEETDEKSETTEDDKTISLDSEEEETEETKKAAKIFEKTFKDWDEDTTEETVETKPRKEKTSYKATLNFLKDKNLIDYDLDEDETLTEDLAAELLEDKYEESLQNKVNAMIEELPLSVKELVKYSLEGGNPDELISKMVQKKEVIIDNTLDISDENNQIAILKKAGLKKGEDVETTDAYIDFLKESGKLENIAEKTFTKMIKEKEQYLENKTKEQAERRKILKLNQRNFKKELSELVSNTSSVKLSAKEKKELPTYIVEPTVELENGKRISELQRDIFKVLNDKEKTIMLAKIIKSDFNFSDLIVDAKTEIVKKLKGNVSNKRKSKTYTRPKTLADLLG